MAKIIGRKEELGLLEEIYGSGKAEFVAVYGRRRIGKTFLVREFFKNRFAFCHTGLSPYELSGKRLLSEQLRNFGYSLARYGSQLAGMPKDWTEAFGLLIELLESQNPRGRQVVFIDELPWLDTPRSGFVTAFEHFWNGWGAGQDNLLLIVCGSASSWISDKLINNTGGLYGRVTREIRLSPFSLAECETFFEAKGIRMDRYDIIQSYMVFGGIPYYLDAFRKGLSFAQNIDALLFGKEAVFAKEFDRLFASLFVNAEDYMELVKLLAGSHRGYTRKEISDKYKASGGGLTHMLSALEHSDFITACPDYKGSARSPRYKLTDPFCLFHLHFRDKTGRADASYWQDNNLSPALNAWRGCAFENICFCHIAEIKRALGISGVSTTVSSWSFRGDDNRDGTQIDMLIDRADRILNLCEIKYCTGEFIISRDYDRKLRERIRTFNDVTGNTRTVHLTLICTFGLRQNEYAGHIQRVITMDDLFR